MDAPLALYRRYRPDNFADVIGQDHVTEPLSHALDNNRVHHAYLFSGPRGCGKTTSARIMARALNCEKGPTSTPCGECESCVELARGGPGSVDVIEIDAASHGGVDDARDLRERAFFAPMKSRYKVYIIDEAHMVTPQGFNALLKLVEEPPSHLRFIFATTEPDKVIATIRSRTHHYPFRLVPPKVLSDYLVDLSSREGVKVEATVLPLVVRAGAGSVRDSLSVLDQLIGGAGADGVTYPLATALLGYTPDSLLDETIDALAADDGATLFGVIDKVVETGHDPRRFAEDLLQRLRDLVVVSVVPNAASRGLLEISADQAERLSGQASRFGRAELTRAADIVSQGLTDMRGATAPRLLLEMMCARILLPGVDQSAEGLGARVDRLERRLSMPVAATTEPPRVSSVDPIAGWPDAAVSPAGNPAVSAAGITPPPATEDHAPPSENHEANIEVAAGAGESPGSKLGVVDIRQLWPGVLDRVMSLRRYAWVLLSQNAHVKAVEDRLITIGFVNAGARDAFMRSGADEILHQALIDELGVDWRVESLIDLGGAPGASRPMQAAKVADSSLRPGSVSGPDSPDSSGRATATQDVSGESGGEAGSRAKSDSGGTDDEIAADDELSADTALTSHELLARELGAQVIDDIRHDTP